NNKLNDSEFNQDIEVLNESLNKLDNSFGNLNTTYSDLKVQFVELEERRNTELENLQTNQSKAKVLTELYKRSSILKTQYKTDISRLKSTIETSVLLIGNHTYNKNCPLCNSKIEESCEDDNVNQVISSCEIEIAKIHK